ncbi:MAG: 2-succinyl-5-enolpyruvyl-6-hydroxy-3-cyclohexene-1-carboxylic-acid synthase [Tannerellaceae bacterium]|nr:2-succinyl-5-enolpyruvyl-6-hydroxy-3-cyclohexene-1-carboxylic-acid synthase [Tannerellaceae bacterium]
MYSNKRNVLVLLSLLRAHDVRDVVLSPGSRNLPLARSVCGDPHFTCHTVVDERSAAFYAIGIAQASSRAVVLCCTSGTAVLNYAPAIAEAYYQRLPLLVVTADRPLSWIGQMTGQTLPQHDVFGRFVRKAVQLPEVSSDDDDRYCNRLVNEAILESLRHGCGPVHINIPVSEPLFGFTARELPKVRKITLSAPQPSFDNLYHARLAKHSKVMIIAGQRASLDASALSLLTDRHGCVALGEHISGLPGSCHISNFDAVLGSLGEEERPAFAPSLLITMGGHVVSKRIRRFLRANPPAEHWHVSPSGEITDTYQCLTEVIESEGCAFVDFLSRREPSNSDAGKPYSALWTQRSAAIPCPGDEYSDLAAAGALMRAMPHNANLQLANSSAVRLAQLFALSGKQKVYSNRGTGGIDGCLSTATGQAAVSEGLLTFLLIGDLAFFYDMNILWSGPLNPRLRIMVNNNGGGGIFETLEGLDAGDLAVSGVSASHTLEIGDMARSLGMLYLPVSKGEDLDRLMPVFTSEKGDRPVLMEVFTSKEKNSVILKNYFASLSRLS